MTKYDLTFMLRYFTSINDISFTFVSTLNTDDVGLKKLSKRRCTKKKHVVDGHRNVCFSQT